MAPRRYYRAMLFDVDGTLVDSNDAHARSWTDALKEHGVQVEFHQVRPFIGMGGDKLLPAIADISESSSQGQAIAKRKKEIFNHLLRGVQPTRGARALLSYLCEHDVTLVIATSADDQELAAILAQAGLEDLIPNKTSKSDAPVSKPDPDIVHSALTRAEASPDEAFLVGDTPYDIEAANRAGVASIALRCGGHWSDEALRGAVAIYNDPQDLLSRWQQRAARPAFHAG
jgi:HAD superfamily hydrolase (TIGR01509 family)